MPSRRRKDPKDMDTDELVDHLFHPDVAEVLRDAIAEHDTDEEGDVSALPMEPTL